MKFQLDPQEQAEIVLEYSIWSVSADHTWVLVDLEKAEYSYDYLLDIDP